MITTTIKRLPDRCLWAALLIATVYQSYRYPFQMNSSGTSPTYSDTPVAFQLFKFVLLLIVCAVSFRYVFKRTLKLRQWSLAILTLCLAAFCIAKAAGGDIEDKIHYLDVAFWPIATLILVLSSRSVSVTALDKYFRFVFIYTLASTLLEVALFLAFGRLPALAYVGTLSIRFGGFLDDPNGFAAILYFLAGWAFYRYTGRKRLWVISSLAICLVLTQSFTALGFLLLFGLFLLVIAILRARKLPLIFILAGSLAFLLVLAWPYLVDLAPIIVGDRTTSVDQHISQVTGTQAESPVWWLFGDDTYQPYESWWYSSVVNFGIPWTLLNFAISGILTFNIYRAFRRASDSRIKAVLCGTLLLSCYFMVGSGNLPFFVIFPINFLFYFFAYLVFFEKIEDPQALDAAPSAVGASIQ